MEVKQIAVIGAGVSGLGAIKSCLEEGLEPTCFEKSNDIGGLWRYEEIPESGRPGIYKSLTCNTSKEMTAFSDYPVPDHYPNYMHNSKIMEYLRMYAGHFGLMKHIQFQTRVCKVRKRPDFSSSGQWDVVVEADGKQKTYIFDGVMVCSGHYTEKYLPLQDFAGITKFQGRYLHSWEYKHPDDFAGKRVVVIGIGNSGADVAGEISRVAEQVWRHTLILFLGVTHQQRLFLSHQSIFSDDLPNRIITGKVVVKTNVKEFTSTSAIFEDGSEEIVDVVVFATGYTFSFPFLDDSSEILDSQHTMFKFVFPPQLEKPTLAFIGILQPVGATIPTSELQSRWVTRVFAGLQKLPSQSCMMADITRRKRKDGEREFVKSPRGIHRVQYIDYMDEIASELGVKPSLLSLLLWDTKLAKEIFWGPCTPYQYRLQGPGKWAGARAAILTQRDRILKPLRTRVLKNSETSSSSLFWVTCICAVVFLFVPVLVIMHVIYQ
ncbi:Dimethylaniline monooxygenase [Apodemus speciosus]|uniref:Flavin-containing monooxygenase n=1 Tax=Apodemus speciosus TaxID=105296 RepID=A0ABQ0EFU5_APOSI